MRRAVLIVLLGVAVGGGWWLVSRPPGTSAPPDGTGSAPSASTTPSAPIEATLYYVAENGTHLTGVDRAVPAGDTITEQARRVVEAQLEPAPEALLSAIPPGTQLLNLFVTEAGDAFVDLSGEVRSAHAGGSLDELFTVYAIVNAITVNVPAVTGVQILIDGREVDTLAGHVDLRRPLRRNLDWVENAPSGSTGAI